MAPMHRPGTTAVLEDQAGFEAQSEQAAVLARAVPAAAVPAVQPGAGFPVTMSGVPGGRQLPCTDDPDLFFAESPDDVEYAKDLCRGCPARMACLTGALERREPWGVWGGELFLRGEIVPRKRPRGRPRKHEVAA
jgi:WhiB family transcriptional regulator, redox-sensing transcriptional regulator